MADRGPRLGRRLSPKLQRLAPLLEMIANTTSPAFILGYVVPTSLFESGAAARRGLAVPLAVAEEAPEISPAT